MSVVYVVDDRADARELCVTVLRGGGHEPVAFASPVEALAAIRTAPPDVVVSDLLMPELDGFELLGELRGDPETRDQPIVLTSAVYTDAEFAAFELGARCVFLAKPAAPQKLLDAVALAFAPDRPAATELPSDLADRRCRLLNRKLLQEGLRWEAAEGGVRAQALRSAAIARLGQQALAGRSSGELKEDACRLVQEQLGVELVELLRRRDNGRELVVAAGRGWRAGVVGSVVYPEPGSLAEVALRGSAATLSRRSSAGRLPLGPTLVEHGVVDGIASPIWSRGSSIGVLAAYSRTARDFDEDERSYLQSVANVVGAAIAGRLAREEVEAQRRELRAVFDGSRDALALIDGDLRCIEANSAFLTLNGLTKEQAIGMQAAAAIAPECWPDFESGWLRAVRGEQVRTRVLRPDGVRRDVEYVATHDVVPGVHLIALRDVTERVELDEELQSTLVEVEAAQSRYHDLIESLPDGIVVVDGDGAIMLVNEEAERMFGYPRSELLGSPLELLVPERLRERRSAALGSSAWARTLGTSLERTGRRKDGSEFPVEVSLSMVDRADGVLVTAVVSDVTQRRRLEEQLHHAQKMDAIGRLAGGIAHDFNNLLQVIGGWADALNGRLSDEAAAADLAEISAAVGRAAALTRQLLAFGRRQVLEPAVLDVNAVVRDMERMLARIVGEDVALILDLEPQLDHVRADRAQLEQVLANVTSNARAAMPAGGRLSISTRNVGGDVAPGAGRDGISLLVADTGCGMDAETLARVFEPFFTTKEEHHGTGLGLATVHGIVTQSGGHIELESEPGRGTRVRIWLPAAEGDSAAPERGPEPGGVLGGDERILLVEDDPVVRRFYFTMLERLGYRVTGAARANAAIEEFMAAEGGFDLVLTDFVMPGMSGRELVERLRELGPVPRTLFVSGYAPGDDISEALATGHAAFLQKPFSSDELARRVRALLDEPA